MPSCFDANLDRQTDRDINITVLGKITRLILTPILMISTPVNCSQVFCGYIICQCCQAISANGIGHIGPYHLGIGRLEGYQRQCFSSLINTCNYKIYVFIYICRQCVLCDPFPRTCFLPTKIESCISKHTHLQQESDTFTHRGLASDSKLHIFCKHRHKHRVLTV